MNTSRRTPFFIWFTGRAGSTLLCDLLNSHPEIYCRMEDFSENAVANALSHEDSQQVTDFNGVQYARKIFQPDSTIDNPSQEQALKYLEQIFSQSEKACGFKFKFPTQAAVFPEITKQLHEVDGLKVIELIRSNVLKQAISLRNVERIRQLDSQRSCNVIANVELEPLQVDVETVVKHANYFLKTRDDFHAVAAQFPSVLPVTYEQICFDAATTMRSILEFLDVDPAVELKTKFFKTTPDSIATAVANYDELAAAVAGTRLEAFLD